MLLQSNTRGYELKPLYFLKLEGGRDKTFPAVYKKGGAIVFSVDYSLIKAVWGMLPPRRSEVGVAHFHVNSERGIGFPVLGPTQSDNEKSSARVILTHGLFVTLTADEQQPFEWEPGAVGEELPLTVFHHLIARANEKMTETA